MNIKRNIKIDSEEMTKTVAEKMGINENVKSIFINESENVMATIKLPPLVIMKYMFLLISLLLVSCKSINSISDNDNCIENIKFKDYFFSNLNYIEENIYDIQDEKFRKSLKNLSKYVHVSFDEMSNYANTYPSGVFEKDKKTWLEWYEKNKCNNLQI